MQGKEPIPLIEFPGSERLRRNRERCPICETRPRDPDTREDARGRHWCQPCQDEHDSIDWDAVAERRMEQ